MLTFLRIKRTKRQVVKRAMTVSASQTSFIHSFTYTYDNRHNMGSFCWAITNRNVLVQFSFLFSHHPYSIYSYGWNHSKTHRNSSRPNYDPRSSRFIPFLLHIKLSDKNFRKVNKFQRKKIQSNVLFSLNC